MNLDSISSNVVVPVVPITSAIQSSGVMSLEAKFNLLLNDSQAFPADQFDHITRVSDLPSESEFGEKKRLLMMGILTSRKSITIKKRLFGRIGSAWNGTTHKKLRSLLVKSNGMLTRKLSQWIANSGQGGHWRRKR